MQLDASRPLPRTTTSTHFERVLRLRTFEGYSTMTPNELASIAENSTDRFFAVGAELLAEGEPPSSLYYVLEGRVTAYRKAGVVAVFEAPSVVGGLAIFAGSSDGMQVLADTPCWTLEMPASVMEDVFEDNFALLLLVIRGISREFVNVRRESGPNAGISDDIAELDCPLPEKLSVVDRLFHLRRNMVFLGGRIQTLTRLAQQARERRFPAGSELWKVGASTGKWQILVCGIVECKNSNQSFRFGPGSSIGGLDALAGVPRWYAATTATDVVTLEVDAELMFDIFEDDIDLAMEVCRGLAGFMIDLREKNARDRPNVANRSRANS